ncbi:hypothetical protein CPB97_007478 [Podila verticillata]|nr:hypothetical protein CPB97_007478 [Podila verticillata]
MSKASNTKGSVAVSLPSLADILNDLSSLRSESISLSQQANNLDDDTSTKPSISGVEKLANFKGSIEKSQSDAGVVENGFEVATEFLRMQQHLTEAKQEMDTLHERMTGLSKELTEVRELIAFNPIK